MNVYFVSSNKYKIREVEDILSSDSVTVIGHGLKIEEIQSESMEKIVKDKAEKAYSKLMRPLFVEQTGLYIHNFGDLPGGLTQVFWDALQADKFCEVFSTLGDSVTAETVIAFCDGKKTYVFKGAVEGKIVDSPRGDRSFQWDCVFQPNGYDRTFAEMGNEKNKISMRRIALEELKRFLQTYR